jgi:hypothetical protein
MHRTAIQLVRQIKPTAKAQYLIRNNSEGLLMYDLYTAEIASLPIETPSDSADGRDENAGGDATGVLSSTGTNTSGYGGIQVKGK